LPEIFFNPRQELELTQYLCDIAYRPLVCWRRRLFSWNMSEVSQTLVRLTPDVSERGSNNSDSCLQRRRSVCYTRLGSKAPEYHYHTAMTFMAAYLSPTRPLIDPKLNFDLTAEHKELYYRLNTGTGLILRDNVNGNSCRFPLAHFLTSLMPPPLSTTSLWPSILSCLDM
jgi:hypothetical protein